jgi:hypothetical protein
MAAPYALRKIRIENFKAIAKFELSFPAKQFSDDLDIWVLGSRNGVGKTSVLQAVSLLCLAHELNCSEIYTKNLLFEPHFDFVDSVVRAGSAGCRLIGEFEIDGLMREVSLTLSYDGVIRIEGGVSTEPENLAADSSALTPDVMMSRMKAAGRTDWRALLGMSVDPFVLGQVLYFHSNRRVAEGAPQLGSLMHSNEYPRPPENRGHIVSLFKNAILKLLFKRSELIRDNSARTGELSLFETLLKTYAGCELATPPLDSEDNGLDIRLQRLGECGRFSIDGLSSGQKEILCTLFLTSAHSARLGQALVLVDEPELHLNSEWHKKVVLDLVRVAPNAQVILATHSERVFASVPSERRLILEM